MPEYTPTDVIRALNPEAEQAQAAREAAALRMKHSAQPPSGRQEGTFTKVVTDPGFLASFLPPVALHNMYQKAREGDYMGALSAAPIAGTAVARAGLKGVDALMRAAPKTMALGAGAAGMMAPAAAGEHGSPGALVPMPRPNPVRQQEALGIEAQRRAQEVEEAKARGLNQADIDKVTAQNQMTVRMEEQRKQAELARENQAKAAEQPWRERNPGLANALSMAGVGAAAAFPAIGKATGTIMKNAYAGRWEDAVKRAATVADQGGAPALRAANELKAFQAGVGAPPKGSTMTALGVGAAAPLTDSYLPLGIDAGFAPEGSPAKKQAVDSLMDPRQNAERIMAGLITGVPAAVTGHKLGSFMPQRLTPAAASQGLVNTIEAGADAAKRAAIAQKSAATRAAKVGTTKVKKSKSKSTEE